MCWCWWSNEHWKKNKKYENDFDEFIDLFADHVFVSFILIQFSFVFFVLAFIYHKNESAQ